MCAKSLQLCLTLWDPMDYSLPGSSVHGIFQTRILEWLLCPSPGDFPDPGIEPLALMSLALAGGFFFFFFFTTSATCWKGSYDQPGQHIKKQRHYFVNKGPSSQGYGFSSGHVWMWELDYKESWAEELMVLNCGVGEDSWESLGLQGDPTSPS